MERPEDISLPPSPPGEFASDLIERTESPKFLTVSSFETPRRASSPVPASPFSPNYSSQNPPKVRNRSPSSRSQQHTSSSAGTSMQRAHSSPGVDSTGRFIIPPYTPPHRPSSPLGRSNRRRSPLRSAMDEPYPGVPSWSGLSIEPNIPEHAELDIPSSTLPPLSTVSEHEFSQNSPTMSFNNTFPRARRRPTSPLHQSASAPTLYMTAASPTFASAGSSPILAAQRYANEPYPHYSFGSASSMPSTPTSLRSRSPSISSLETIPDSPDAEEAAMLEAEEARNRAAEEGETKEGGDSRRRSALGNKKERKIWSVCGAERRADFSLEPIEE